MTDTPERAGRSRAVDLGLLAVAMVVFITLIGLGNWQLRRLAWKLDLIETVEARAYADPVPAPIGTTDLEYLRVVLTGTYRHEDSLEIKAVTELGPGNWLMTPLDGAEQTVWVNRGFVPGGPDPVTLTRPEGPVTVTGLVRLSQPGGTLLENNAPADDRWVSADIAAMSDNAGLQTADYFVDADHAGAASDWPRGGMTRLNFRNSHLSYALTWYAMAALLLAGMAYVIRDRLRSRRRTSGSTD